MPRPLPPPPASSPPDAIAASLIEAIRAYARGTDAADVSPTKRAIGMHHLACIVNDEFNSALLKAQETLAAEHRAGGPGAWHALRDAHGLSVNTLQNRIDRARGIPPRPGKGRVAGGGQQ